MRDCELREGDAPIRFGRHPHQSLLRELSCLGAVVFEVCLELVEHAEIMCSGDFFIYFGVSAARFRGEI